jgi:leucyl/phenylalanyl-tRNA--protein transferase
MIPWLQSDTPFPDVATALTEADGASGLLAAGADLSPERLLLAYHQGIFPWFSEGQPILWWSTDPRLVLFCDRFAISRSLEKSRKKVARSMHAGGEWEVRFDSAFEAVMRACAEPRRDGAGTWISEDIIAGYCGLHHQGYAHSSELWLRGQLVGGLYGVSIGHMFYGESMFARVTDASKIALTYLVTFLKANGVTMIDCQQQTAHLSSLGAIAITRAEFIARLRLATAQAQIKNWKPPDLY